jgi:hypothetical protein
MMRCVKAILKCLIAGVAAMGLLTLFVLVYGHSGIHIANPSGATDYKWRANQYKSTMTEGFAWLRMDGNGFNNRDIPEKTDILLMGSSHMEAVNVDQSETTASCLADYLRGDTVYNIGTSGHTIYQCAKNIENAVREYSPSGFVVVETDRVVLRNEEMERVLDGELPTIPSYDSGLLFYIQRYCPAMKAIYKQVVDWRAAGKNDEDPDMAKEEMHPELLDRFLSKMRSDCGADRELLSCYHPKTRLDATGELVLPDPNDAAVFSEACERNGILFVDVSEPIRRLYEEQDILAYGFANTAVGSGHLNPYGHRVVAERLAEVIMEERDR